MYNHYLRHCAAKKIDAVNAASFGKLIRSVFIGLKTRRLGTRFVHVHVCVYVYICVCYVRAGSLAMSIMSILIAHSEYYNCT